MMDAIKVFSVGLVNGPDPEGTPSHVGESGRRAAIVR
jgi:hypothetical protein